MECLVQLILVWWFTKRDTSESSSAQACLRMNQNANSTHPGPLSSRVWRPKGKQHDTIRPMCSPTSKPGCSYYVLRPRQRISPMGRGTAASPGLSYCSGDRVGIKDAFLSTLLRCIGALVDICYVEKLSSSRRCLIYMRR